MEPEDLAWVAGLLEGEGSFTLRKSNVPKIHCQMTDEDVLLKLQEKCGGKIYFSERTEEQRAKNWKDSWTWNLQGRPAADLMRELMPHMGKRRSEKIKEILSIYSKHRLKIDGERERQLKRYFEIATEYIETDLTYRGAKEKYNITAPTLAKYVTIVRENKGL